METKNTNAGFTNNFPLQVNDEYNPIIPGTWKSFFTDYSLNQCHHYLWKLVRMAFTGRKNNLDHKQLSNLMSFYENMVNFLRLLYADFEKQKEISSTEQKSTQLEMKKRGTLLEGLFEFLECASPERLNRNLSKMVIDYIPRNKNFGNDDFDEFLIDLEKLNALLDFLDVETKDYQPWNDEL